MTLTPIEFSAVAGAVLGAGALVALRRPEWIVDWPRTVLAVLGLITLAFGAAMLRFDPLGFRIGIDASSEPLLPENDPGEPVYQRAILDFGDDDVFVVAMETDDVFTHSNLQTLRDVSDEIKKLPGVRGTESVVDVYTYRWNEAKGLVEMGRLIGPKIPTDAAEIADLRRRALSDPIYPRTILAKDGRAAAINVTFKSLSDDEFVKLDLDGRIQSILGQFTHPGVRFHVTGRPHVRAQAHVLLVHDLARLVPIAVIVSVCALWLMTGSVRGTLVPLLFNLMCTFWSYGAMAVMGGNMNLITLVMGPALITIGGVTGVHSYACYQEFAEKSKTGREAGLRTLNYTAEVVLIAGLTTIVGFAALLINEIPATNELGGYCIFGVASITVIVLTGLPALLSLLPLHANSGKPLFSPQTRMAEAFQHWIEEHLERLAYWQIRHRNLVLLSWASTGLLACVLMPFIVTDTDFITFFRQSSAVRQDFDAVNKLLTGAVPIYVVLDGDKEGTFREPEALRAVERLEARIEKLPGVTAVVSAVDLVKVAKQALDEGDPNQARIPDTRAELAELMFMIPKEKLRAFATSNHSSANILVRTDRLGSAALRELEDAIHAELAAETLPEGVHGDVTGNTIRINRGADGIAGNQVAQLTLTIVCCLLIVILVFRSLGLGILAMPTNVLPVFLFYGALGAGVAPLSIPISLIGSVALGITVDDTSHYLQAFRHRRAEGIAPDKGVVACTMEVCRAMVVTSTMEITGFLVMTFSGFATLQQFGYLTAITMTLCLATDVLMLPALVVRFQSLVQPRPEQVAAALLERQSSDAA
jgi:uncharacterized protein